VVAVTPVPALQQLLVVAGVVALWVLAQLVVRLLM
jgi:hypothetical protein